MQFPNHALAPYPLHERIREERLLCQISQTELGRRLGKSQDWVSRVENGQWEVPGRLLPALAHALGITVSRLFNEAFLRAG